MSTNTSEAMIEARATASEARGRAGFRIFDWLSAWRRAKQSRKALYRLLALDDRMLADIGLTRGDVEMALNEPAGSDHQAFLTACRAEHLSWNRSRRKVE